MDSCNGKTLYEILFSNIKKEAASKIIYEPPGLITGFDINRRAVSDARVNISHTGLNKIISVDQENFLESKPKHDKGFIIMNPPYGERIKVDDTIELYKSIGDTLKNRYIDYTIWIPNR